VNARAIVDDDGYLGHTSLFHTVVKLAPGMGLYDDSKARLLLDRGADPNARATIRKEEQTHGKPPPRRRFTALRPSATPADTPTDVV